MQTFFPIIGRFLKPAFVYHQHLLFQFSSIVTKGFSFIVVFNFGKRKNSTGSKSGEYDWLWFCIWPKTHAQYVRYQGTKSMIRFLIILCVSDENRKEQWTKPLDLTGLEVLSSLLALLDTSIGMINASSSLNRLIEKICIIVERRQHPQSDVNATFLLLKVLQFRNTLCCSTFHAQNIR